MVINNLKHLYLFIKHANNCDNFERPNRNLTEK